VKKLFNERIKVFLNNLRFQLIVLNGLISGRVDCLILFNALATAAGWFEWASRKKTNKLLHKQGVNQARFNIYKIDLVWLAPFGCLNFNIILTAIKFF